MYLPGITTYIANLEINNIINKEHCLQRKLINDQMDITHHM